ncbi:hypothetical protein EMMF5_006614, partial [Cystobasidiomycetes sp. EMM_F5]
LRVHPYQEWHDLYIKENMDDLQRFFDFYTKGIENGWESDTAAVRLSLLAYHGSPAKAVLNRPEAAYPLERTQYKTLYLDAAARHLLSKQAGQDALGQYEGSSLTSSL